MLWLKIFDFQGKYHLFRQKWVILAQKIDHYPHGGVAEWKMFKNRKMDSWSRKKVMYPPRHLEGGVFHWRWRIRRWLSALGTGMPDLSWPKYTKIFIEDGGFVADFRPWAQLCQIYLGPNIPKRKIHTKDHKLYQTAIN
jgi:hypothetical protein